MRKGLASAGLGWCLLQRVLLMQHAVVQERGVPVHRLVHREGSFVITFPNAYHAGFNTGALLIHAPQPSAAHHKR